MESPQSPQEVIRQLALRRTMAVILAGVLFAGCGGSTEPRRQTPASPTTENPEAVGDSNWLTDKEKARIKSGNDARVAAWFGISPQEPYKVRRYWRKKARAQGRDAAGRMTLALELLRDPPARAHSSFGRGLDVLGVRLQKTQVLVDLRGSSPGLQGHGSSGAALGSKQLEALAAFYFPEAKTLCVAFDGVPTSFENQEKRLVGAFLHDDAGCPMELP